MSLTPDQIKEQSLRAYGQWREVWRKNALTNSKFAMKSLEDFENSGVGKAVLCVANGESFQTEIETIKKYKDNVDILCCDKTLGHLLENGIKPTFCIVCDAKVDYAKYMEKWKDQLQDTILFSNVCANPEWAENGNWKDKYFFGNMDVLGSEKEFMGLAGCPNAVPAGTNVSNALVVFMTQSDNTGRKNFFGYDKILLIGFDYSWTEAGNYYAFDKEGNGKHNYMRHMYLRNANNDLCFTSNNLAFSAKWLESYLVSFKLPVVQCSKATVLPIKNMGVLAEQMQYSFKQDDQKKVVDLIKQRNQLIAKRKQIEASLMAMGREHYYSFIATV